MNAPRTNVADAFNAAGLWLVVAGATCRAMVTIDILPGFDSDPLLLPSPDTAIGPAESVLLDASAIVGLAMVLLSNAISGIRPRALALTLAAIGAVPLLHHLTSAPSPETLRIGWSWIGAMCTALAIIHARPSAARSIAIAAALAFTGVLAAKGVYQVTIEHAITMRGFEAEADAILRARGLEPGTPNAQAFLRRLAQPEASGWFGLSNVYATFAAATTGASLALAALAFQTRHPRRAIAPFALAVIAAIALALSKSKGGVAAAALATATIPVLLSARPRLHKLGTPLIAAAILIPLVALAARAVAGERLAELSLLYRTFYIEGALRIFTENPVTGVGPAGFQQAFLAAKPPLCPEDVTSPHSIAFDWLATLGPASLAWIALVGAWVAARRRTPTDDSPFPLRPTLYALLAFALPATLVSAMFEAPAATTESALMRAAALATWIALAFAILPLLRSERAPLALVPAGVAVLAHAQIEMTLIIPAAAPLAAILIGASVPAPTDQHRPLRATALAPPIGASALAIFAIISQRPLAGWQRTLESQSRAIQTSAATHARAQSPASLRDLALALDNASGRLIDAAAAARDMRTARAASRMALHAQSLKTLASTEADTRALDAARLAVELDQGNPAAHLWLASIVRTTAGPAASVPSLERAAELDPHDPLPAARLAETLAIADQAAEAAAWAQRALDRNQRRRLDPTVQLSEEAVSRLQSLLAGP